MKLLLRRTLVPSVINSALIAKNRITINYQLSTKVQNVQVSDSRKVGTGQPVMPQRTKACFKKQFKQI